MDPAAEFLARAKACAARSVEDTHPATVPGKTAPGSRGKKVETKPESQQEIPSPATTVAAADEDAAEMARVKFQAHRMQTPEEKIRRMPATPTLPRRVQSQELFRAQSLASTVLDAVTPTPAPVQKAKTANKKTGKIGKTKKTGKKPIQKRRKTKTVKKTNKTKKGKAATAKKAPALTAKKTPALTANKTPALTATKTTALPAKKTTAAGAESASNANVDTVATLTPHMAEPVTPSAALTSPAQSPATQDADLARAMTQLYVSSPAAPSKTAVDPAPEAPHVPPETSTPHGPVAPKQTEAKDGQLVQVKTEPGEKNDSASPKPETVSSLLNRGQTTDMAALQALVSDTVKNAMAGSVPTKPEPAEAPVPTVVTDLPKVRTRNKEAHNRRMRFYRTLDSPNSPPEILQLAENARSGSGSRKTDKLAILFEEWMKCGENWKSSSFILRMKETSSESQKGARRWLTQADILAKYQNGRSYEEARDIAQEICSGKENDPHMKVHHIRPHPNCPTRQDMRLFLVWDEEYETHSKDSVVESLFQCKNGDDDKKPSKRKAKNKKKRSSSSCSSSSSGSSSSKSSSSSRRGRKKPKKDSKHGSKNKSGSKNGKSKMVKVSSEGSDDGADTSQPPPTVDPGNMSKAAQRKAKKDAEKKRKQEEREAEKEKKRIKTEEKKQETKEKNQKRTGLKKAVTALDGCIADTVRRENASETLTDPNLKSSLLNEVRAQSTSLKGMRARLQDALDKDQVDKMEALAADAKKKADEYNERKKLMQ